MPLSLIELEQFYRQLEDRVAETERFVRDFDPLEIVNSVDPRFQIRGVTSKFPGVYSLISRTSPARNVEKFSFDSIPNYSNYLLILDLVIADSAGGTGVFLQFNNDTGATRYAWRVTENGNASVFDLSDSRIFLLDGLGTGVDGSRLQFVIHILNISPRAVENEKLVHWTFGGGSNANYLVGIGTGKWGGNIEPIRSIQLSMSSGSGYLISTLSNFALYGEGLQ